MCRISAARRIGAVFAALWCLLSFGIATAGAAGAPAAIEQKVIDQFARKDEATYWVVLRQQADLSHAQYITDWNARGQYVYDQLTQTAERTQAGLRAELKSRGLDYRPHWIVNAVRVTSNHATMLAIASRAEVWQIIATHSWRIPEPKLSDMLAGTEAIEWNIDRINAPQVWSTFGVRGEGVVVANIDTGVHYTHPAVVNQYRGNLGGGNFDHNYNWHDPSSVCGNPSLVPCDNNSHGTHTMGTMVGDDGGSNQIGVAPGARWIAAKGCETNSCSDAALLSSGEWVIAPTDLQGNNPRADLRPQVVNNSWGNTDGSNLFYQATVQAWVAAGIFPQFSNGNSGSGCQTSGSPGSYPESYSAGAFDINNAIAGFSSRGPSPHGGIIKPNISAPGVGVRSSVPPNGYSLFDGTSMASPHVAGTIALMISAAPALLGDITQMRELLNVTAIDTSDLSCGGSATNNNVWGEGRLDAFAAVDQSPRGPTGHLIGTITDSSTHDPIAGATVAVTGPSNRSAVTGETGGYDLRLPIGSYAIAVSAFGYAPGNSNANVRTDDNTIRNFALNAVPSHAVSGIVRDANGAAIANATVTILSTPIPSTTTDASGAYSFASVPEGAYNVKAEAGGCNDSQSQPLTVNGAEALDFVLPARTDSFGHTCRIVAFPYVPANTVIALAGDDDSQLVQLPFPFRFYGQAYGAVSVATNGFVTFGSRAATYTNDSIPSASTPNGAIYAYWDDMFIDNPASVRTQVVGVQPNRRFVIEWRNMSYYADNTRRVTVELVLFERSNVIVTSYRGIAADGREQGNSATFGLENQTGSDALQYSFNTPVIGSPTFGIAFMPPGAEAVPVE
jgi:subtilisin family serine protease